MKRPDATELSVVLSPAPLTDFAARGRTSAYAILSAPAHGVLGGL